MSESSSRGHVLVLCQDETTGLRLVRWVNSIGAGAVCLHSTEALLLGDGDDDSIDVLVTDLDTDLPENRLLIRRLASGDIFHGVPQIHLLRDLSFRKQLLAWNPEMAAVSMGSPPEAGDFKARVRLAKDLGCAQRELERNSVEDSMTGVYNRRYFLARLDQEFSRATRYRSPVSLILADIDHLRTINKKFGQTAGDTVIRSVSELLCRCGRKIDIVGRLGDSCFGVILPGTRHRGAAVLANKTRTEAEGLIVPGLGHELPIHLSAGITCIPGNREIKNPDDMISMAENALSEAKTRGGNRVYIDERVIRSEQRLVMVADPDPSLLEVAEDLLAMDDYAVVLAETGRSAMETLRFRVPDLLILDLQMESADHHSLLLEQIHELFPELPFPVIGMSGGNELGHDQLAELGVDRFITKPFSVSLLRSVARELVDR
jgi:diguanylate cyclase (GGDEF)-like protein